MATSEITPPKSYPAFANEYHVRKANAKPVNHGFHFYNIPFVISFATEWNYTAVEKNPSPLNEDFLSLIPKHS